MTPEMAGIPMIMADNIAELALPKIVILLVMILIFVLLGCVMDCFAIMILMVPILFPIIQLLAFDPIWFGVIVSWIVFWYWFRQNFSA